MRSLPRRAARELQRMVTPLDTAYLSRTTPDPLAAPISPGSCDGSWIKAPVHECLVDGSWTIGSNQEDGSYDGRSAGRLASGW